MTTRPTSAPRYIQRAPINPNFFTETQRLRGLSRLGVSNDFTPRRQTRPNSPAAATQRHPVVPSRLSRSVPSRSNAPGRRRGSLPINSSPVRPNRRNSAPRYIQQTTARYIQRAPIVPNSTPRYTQRAPIVPNNSPPRYVQRAPINPNFFIESQNRVSRQGAAVTPSPERSHRSNSGTATPRRSNAEENLDVNQRKVLVARNLVSETFANDDEDFGRLDMDDDNNNDDSPVLSGDVCHICLGEYEPGNVIASNHQCPHVFHKRCLTDWLMANDNCPVCRQCIVVGTR